jgi:hypothetical protein
MSLKPDCESTLNGSTSRALGLDDLDLEDPCIPASPRVPSDTIPCPPPSHLDGADSEGPEESCCYSSV